MKPFTKIAAIILIVVAIGHLLRIIKGAQLMIGSHEIPMWVSYFGVIVPAIISGGLWRESR